jgi:hypothetical protein
MVDPLPPVNWWIPTVLVAALVSTARLLYGRLLTARSI